MRGCLQEDSLSLLLSHSTPSHSYRSSTKSFQIYLNKILASLERDANFKNSFAKPQKPDTSRKTRVSLAQAGAFSRSNGSVSNGNASVISARYSAEIVNFNQIMYFEVTSLTGRRSPGKRLRGERISIILYSMRGYFVLQKRKSQS